MSENGQVVLPKAMYFDANALIAVPNDLASQPLAELVDAANRFHIGLFVPELAASEWIERCCRDASQTMARLTQGVREIGSLLGRDPLDLEVLAPHELQKAIREVQRERLASVGFQTVSTPRIDLAALIGRFVEKKPPFTEGDKGFKDAVILETVFHHACRECALGHILIVTSDRVFGHRAIADRFAKAGTAIHVVGGPPGQLLPQAMEQLDGMIRAAGREVLAQGRERITAFVKAREAEVFDFVMANTAVTRPFLRGLGGFSRVGDRDENDRKLDHAEILSIDAVRPVGVVSAFPFPGLPRTSQDDRTSILISVLIEIDLTISCATYATELGVPLSEAPVELEEPIIRYGPHRDEAITVRRRITLTGSVSSDGLHSGDLSDLRLEEVGSR